MHWMYFSQAPGQREPFHSEVKSHLRKGLVQMAATTPHAREAMGTGSLTCPDQGRYLSETPRAGQSLTSDPNTPPPVLRRGIIVPSQGTYFKIFKLEFLFSPSAREHTPSSQIWFSSRLPRTERKTSCPGDSDCGEGCQEGLTYTLTPFTESHYSARIRIDKRGEGVSIPRITLQGNSLHSATI